MSLFDLLFLLAILASVVTLATVVIAAVRGRRVQALRILRVYCLCVCAYFVAGLAVSWVRPQRVMRIGEPWCFDDWCLTVENAGRPAGQSNVTYEIGLRLSSRAGRIAQRARGAWIYLVDERGRRYPPDPYPSAVPLDVLLQPNESIATSRKFQVPNDVREVGLITGHGGGYCGPMSFLIMGESGCLFGKPPLVRIP